MDSNSPKLYNIEVYNSIGSKVYSVKAVNKNTSINVSGWNSGIYIVNVLSGNRSFNTVIVKWVMNHCHLVTLSLHPFVTFP